jgi:glycosyltransferase involved in cell wall biosynthesis
MIKIAVLVPEGFFTTPERFGGGIVRAYKIYFEQLSKMPFFEICFYSYNSTNKTLYFTDMMEALVKFNKYKPDVILTPCEVEISMLLAIILGIIARRPVVIIFNAIPLTGHVGSGLSLDEKKAFKYIIQSCIGSNDLKNIFLCGAKSVTKFLLVLVLMYTARFLRRQIIAIAVTPHIGRELQRRKLKVVDIYPGNGIDVPQRMLNSTKIYDSCYIANPIHIEKGLLDVLYIWRIVTRENPMAKLIIAGKIAKDLSENKLRGYIQRLYLGENIDLRISYETISRGEILNIMSRCKVFIYPSRKDTWGLIVGEAMSIGLPAIAYALPGIEYAYSWCQGIKLVKVGDIITFSRETTSLLKNNELLSYMSNIALKCARKMSWRKVALLEIKAILKALRQYYLGKTKFNTNTDY